MPQEGSFESGLKGLLNAGKSKGIRTIVTKI